MPTIPYKQLKDENGTSFYPVCGESSFSGAVPLTRGGTGASTAAQARENLDVPLTLKQAQNYQDAYDNATSIIAVNAQDTSGNNWIVWIPKALITTSARVWSVGDFHNTSDFNNFKVEVTTTTCSALRMYRDEYPQGTDIITYWYM